MVVDRQDRRVQKTRHLFQEALIKLLKENRYSSISIEDLADQANLGRTTFYLHYPDKDALLEECVICVLSKLTEKTHSLLTTRWNSHDLMALKILFEFACENEQFIRVMLHDPCGFVFFQRFQIIVVDLLNQELNDETAYCDTTPKIPLEFPSTFFAGAILATIKWWVDNEKPYSDAQMVEMVSNTLEKAMMNGQLWRVDHK